MSFITNCYIGLCIIVILLLSGTKCSNTKINANQNIISMVDKQALLNNNLAVSRQKVQVMGEKLNRQIKQRIRRSNDRLVFDHSEKIVTKQTTKIPQILNVTQQRFVNNTDGEYEYSFKLTDGMRRAERGEYEYRNGQLVFVIRGFFGHVTKTGDFKITAYIFDHNGYHEIPTGGAVVTDFRPDGSDEDCDLAKGQYCIDQKLLALMVG